MLRPIWRTFTDHRGRASRPDPNEVRSAEDFERLSVDVPSDAES